MRAMGAWMREKKKRGAVAVTCKKWGQTGEEGIESWEVGLGVCVCVLLCVAAHSRQQHRGGAQRGEGQNCALCIEKHINLRPIITTNMRGKH